MSPCRTLCLLVVGFTLSLSRLGCDLGESGNGGDTSSRAPVQPRATMVWNPPVLGIGEVGQLELVVVTPAEHRVLPFSPPKISGLWLLDHEMLPIRKEGDRWLHRSLFRVRTRELGVHRWPASQVIVEDSEGERSTLDLDASTLEVVSARSKFPDRSLPFGYRTRPEARPGQVWLAAAAGAGAVLLALGLLHAVRRLRSRPEQPEGEESAAAPASLFGWAEGELARARASVASNPQAAARTAAILLRRFVARRFDADTRGVTTEELARSDPPWAARSRWPDFLRILGMLDTLRFQKPPTQWADQDRAQFVHEALAEIERFVAGSKPPGANA